MQASEDWSSWIKKVGLNFKSLKASVHKSLIKKDNN
jgi:hypothetical protein